MIPFYIGKIFSDEGLAKELSENAKAKAAKTHNRGENGRRLLGIYEKIANA